MPNSLNMAPDTVAQMLGALPNATTRVQPHDNPTAIRTSTVVTGYTPLRNKPDTQAGQLTDVLFGEQFNIFEEANGWAHGQAVTDSYVGFLPSSALGGVASATDPTHRIAVPLSHLYGSPDFKRPPLDALPMCARLSLTGQQEAGFSEICPPDGSDIIDRAWVPTPHVRTISDLAPDFADTALAFLGSPYVWGGRTAGGIDCSGLVQISLATAGYAVPRDSDMQEVSVGAPIDSESLQRGDLVFFPRHVGVMTSTHDIVHANATFMAVTHEPLSALVGRLKTQHSQPITSARRIPGSSPR